MAERYFELLLGHRVVQLRELDDGFLLILLVVIMWVVFLSYVKVYS